MKYLKTRIQSSLNTSPPWVFVLFVSLSAFLTYSCMYAFRKTFTAATFDQEMFLGIHYKIWLITSQLIGYTLSKFIGIKLVSEMQPQNRAKYILLVIGMAQIALFFFAITPPPYNIIWMFFNGLPLGVVWGLVFAYLEGRRTTEILGAIVSISFIFASGFVKSVGKFILLNFSVSEYWMPFIAGAVFTLPLAVAVWLLNMVPPPSPSDKSHRTERLPMNKKQRKVFLIKFITILIPLTIVYIFLTVLRDIRDNFAAEIWIELGMGNAPGIFTSTEIPVGISVLLIIALMAYFKNNYLALNLSLVIVVIGLLVNILATFAFQMNTMNGIAWMISMGFGLYLGYIAFHALLFERFIATFREVGNIGFLFYFSDAIGYLGSVSSFLMKNFFSPDISWVSFLGNLSWVISMAGIVLCFIAYCSIKSKYRNQIINVY